MAFIRFHDRIVNLLAAISGFMLVWLMIAIVASVLTRNMGLQPPGWLFASTEYAMFYLTLLGAPWLVRERGHVFVEVLINLLPPGAMVFCSKSVVFLCAIMSYILAWKGLELVIFNIQNSDYDVRLYFIPMWIFNIAYPVSFFLMGVEFSRFVFSKNSFHQRAKKGA